MTCVDEGDSGQDKTDDDQPDAAEIIVLNCMTAINDPSAIHAAVAAASRGIAHPSASGSTTNSSRSHRTTSMSGETMARERSRRRQ